VMAVISVLLSEQTVQFPFRTGKGAWVSPS